MKTMLAVLLSALVSHTALAAAPSCLATATEKKLSGAAKSGFMRKCVREQCDATAAEKKLSGAARNSFATKCLADGLQPYCEEQAGGKKLAGAAKNSFMSKCQSGN